LKGAGEELVMALTGRPFSRTTARCGVGSGNGKPLWAETFDLGHAGEVLGLSVSGDGKRLASASADGSVRLWDLTTGKPLNVWRGHEARRPMHWTRAGFTALDLSRDGRWLLSAGSEGRLRLIDTSTEKVAARSRFQSRREGWPPPVRVPAGRHTSCRTVRRRDVRRGSRQAGSTTHKLAIWDMRTGKLEAKHSVPSRARPQRLRTRCRHARVEGRSVRRRLRD
jgi:WD40 repeat protein